LKLILKINFQQRATPRMCCTGPGASRTPFTTPLSQDRRQKPFSRGALRLFRGACHSEIL